MSPPPYSQAGAGGGSELCAGGGDWVAGWRGNGMQLDWVQVINQLFSSGLTACFTIIGGVAVLAVGQIVLKLFVEPMHEQAKLLGEIAHSITFFANTYGNASLFDEDKVLDASNTLRKQASQLRASAWTIR
jgi:hypothetical protein